MYTDFTDKEKEILSKRAKELARKDVPIEIKENEYLVCTISGENYGFSTRFIQEVFVVEDITPLPSTPDWLLGIISARGEIISVVDIKKFFDLDEPVEKIQHKVIIVSKDEIKLGLLIDFVEDIININSSDLTKDFITFDKIRKEYLTGITENNFIILDIDKLLSDPKLSLHHEL